MTPTVTPFQYRGAYGLASGNRLTIVITADHDRTEDKYSNLKAEYIYTEKPTKEDLAEAKLHLKESFAECGFKPEDLEQPKAVK